MKRAFRVPCFRLQKDLSIHIYCTCSICMTFLRERPRIYIKRVPSASTNQFLLTFVIAGKNADGERWKVYDCLVIYIRMQLNGEMSNVYVSSLHRTRLE
jgi:hypothetical protein